MRLTRRGRAALLALLFAAVAAVAFLTSHINIDYSEGVPRPYDNRVDSRNMDQRF